MNRARILLTFLTLISLYSCSHEECKTNRNRLQSEIERLKSEKGEIITELQEIKNKLEEEEIVIREVKREVVSLAVDEKIGRLDYESIFRPYTSIKPIDRNQFEVNYIITFRPYKGAPRERKEYSLMYKVSDNGDFYYWGN